MKDGHCSSALIFFRLYYALCKSNIFFTLRRSQCFLWRNQWYFWHTWTLNMHCFYYWKSRKRYLYWLKQNTWSQELTYLCSAKQQQQQQYSREYWNTKSKYLITVVSRFTLRALLFSPLLPTGVTVLMILLQSWSNMRFWLTCERFYPNNE